MRKSIRRLLTVAMTAVLATGGLCYTADQTKTIEAAETYQLVWSDEFNGTSLDTNTWSYDIGNGDWGWGNGEVQYYTNRTKNVEVADGYLQIHALKESYGGKSYTSGRILSKGKKYFKYGKIEAKIKVENGNQSGVWPAYWMMGENMADGVGWPYCGEIDIMEHANSNNYVGGCLHWNTNGLNGDYSHGSYGSGFEGAENSYGYFTDNTNNGINGWHTYTLIWDENHMEWQLDGKTYLTQEITDNNAYCFQKEQFFLFNLAIGGTGTGFTNYQTANDATYQTATMYVDYLRVYQLKEGSTTQQQTTTAKETTTPAGETVVDYKTVDSVAENTGVFEYYFGGDNGWGDAKGTVTNAKNTGADISISSVGNSLWQIQTFLKNLTYIAGNTYTYKCTIKSDVTKSIRVKVVGDNDSYIFSQDDITVQAGVPYQYEKTVTIPANYTGRLDLYFGLGKNTEVSENIDSSTKMNVSISNVSFVTEKKTVTFIPSETTTISDKTTEKVTTTKDNGTNVKKLKRAKIKKLTAKKKSLKIKIKKVSGAKGYQIKYSTKKNFSKSKTKTTKKLTYKLKGLKSNKKYYVKVRAYVKNSKGKKVYGKFSKRKKATTK